MSVSKRLLFYLPSSKKMTCPLGLIMMTYWVFFVSPHWASRCSSLRNMTYIIWHRQNINTVVTALVLQFSFCCHVYKFMFLQLSYKTLKALNPQMHQSSCSVVMWLCCPCVLGHCLKSMRRQQSLPAKLRQIKKKKEKKEKAFIQPEIASSALYLLQGNEPTIRPLSHIRAN